MKLRSVITAICVLATANLAAAAPFAYVANSGNKTVSVIDTATDTVTATVPLATGYAYSVAVSPSGQYVYVGLQTTNEIAVIDAARNVVIKRIGLGTDTPGGLAVNAAETRLYVTSNMSNTLIVIDISGFPTEVGRVAVADEPTSNPEGVIISPAGDKAYVANSGTGTVAEIALDEAHNIYTRSSLTTVGSKPMGLAISSTGSKLYVADAFGAAAMVDTATKAVTNLTVGAGTVSVAITADNSKVFAPSNTLDKLYVIDGTTDVVSGTQYAVAYAPFGSAVNPAGTKLYLAMYGSDNVKVVDTTTNLVTATIPIVAGAKPTSMGDFIGPVFDYTITSSNGANCNILPLGTVSVVKNYGRSFSISPTTGACEVKVDGVSVGQPSTYAITNVITNGHTIDASQAAAGTYYTVTADWISSVGGCLVSTPAGINCSSKSAQFLAGTTVNIAANTNFNATTWTGACAGTVGGKCTLAALAADKTLGATVITGGGTGPIFDGANYYQSLDAATAAAANGATLKIASTYILGGSTPGAIGNIVTLSGGWDAPFATQSGSVSMGALTITTVGVIADNLTI